MLLEKFPHLKALILDMDGVLWQDTQAIGNLLVIFERIESLGLQVVLATNNATRNVDEYIHKLASFAVSLEKEKIITSSQATGAYLAEHFPPNSPIYVLGTDSLKTTLAGYGFQHTDADAGMPPVAVVVGLDRHITYAKLVKANALVRQGALLIGTNPDVTYPTPTGLQPGAGTIVKAVETASETEALIIGKPKPELFNIAMHRMQVQPHETLAVGDRLETDIAAAQAVGCYSALVLSGSSTIEQAQRWSPQPDLITDDLEALLN